LKLVDGVFEVKATGGDSALGGDDIDRAIANTMLEGHALFDRDGDRSLDAARRTVVAGRSPKRGA